MFLEKHLDFNGDFYRNQAISTVGFAIKTKEIITISSEMGSLIKSGPEEDP